MASGLTVLWAVMVSGYVPMAVDAGVPARVAVPVPLSTKVTPLGNVPVTLRDGAGLPVVVTVKEPGTVEEKVVLLALVITGAAVYACSAASERNVDGEFWLLYLVVMVAADQAVLDTRISSMLPGKKPSAAAA